MEIPRVVLSNCRFNRAQQHNDFRIFIDMLGNMESYGKAVRDDQQESVCITEIIGSIERFNFNTTSRIYSLARNYSADDSHAGEALHSSKSENDQKRLKKICENEQLNVTEAHKPKERYKSKEDSKIVKQVIYMLVTVVVLFIICWAPLLIENVLTAYSVLPKQRIGKLKHISVAFHLMAYFNR